MKTLTYPISELLGKGLVPTFNPKNRPGLVESVGAVPYENVLMALKAFSQVDTSSLGTLAFPYPQLFVFSEVVIVCTSDGIYELSGSSLVQKLYPVTVGTPWTAIDRKSYIYLTNGAVAVTKNPETGVYAVDFTVPFGSCVCDWNGQIFIGAPNSTYTGA